MFDLEVFQTSMKARDGFSQGLSEAIATAGLLGTIILSLRARPEATAALVASYITAAYWFTSSTSFANPAVTIARSFSDTFAGIAPGDTPLFIMVQIGIAATLAIPLTRLSRATPDQL